MANKPISRKNLWALAQSHMLGHQFTLPGPDRRSEDDDVRLSHTLIEASIRCCIDARIDAADAAGRIREAAKTVDSHVAGSFALTGWKVFAHEKELAFAYLLLEQAIIVRLAKASNPYIVGMWLRDAADQVQAKGLTFAWPEGIH